MSKKFRPVFPFLIPYLVCLLIPFAAFADEGADPTVSTVFGRFKGYTLAEQGAVNIQGHETPEVRLDKLHLYNLETKKKRKFRPDHNGYFLMELPAGIYQVRNRKTNLQARRTKEKYHVFSEFEVKPGALVNLGTYRIFSDSDEWNPVITGPIHYAIVHAEGTEAYDDPVAWLRDKKSELFKNGESAVSCPFPTCPGKPLYQKSVDPASLISNLFGVAPGCTIKELKKAYSAAGVDLSEEKDNFISRGLLTDFIPTSRQQAVFFDVGKNHVISFTFIAVNSYDEPTATRQMALYDTLVDKISSYLGESRSVTHVERNPDTRLADLVAGKAQYSTEWNYDNYSLILTLGGKDLDKDLRDAVFLDVYSVPAWIQG